MKLNKTRALAIGVLMIFAIFFFSGCRSKDPAGTVIREPNEFKSLIGSTHEIVTVMSVTDDKKYECREVDCKTIYSSEPNRPGAGKIYYYEEMFPEVEIGQTYLVSLIVQNQITFYVAENMVPLSDGYFRIDDAAGFWSIRTMNNLVRTYAKDPDPQIKSIPQEELLGDVTIKETIEFLSGMKAACTEWESASWK